MGYRQEKDSLQSPLMDLLAFWVAVTIQWQFLIYCQLSVELRYFSL